MSTMFAPPQYEPQQEMFVPQLTGSQLPFPEQGLPMPQQGGPLVYMAVPHVSPRGYHPYGMPMLAPMMGPHWSGNHFSNVPPQYTQLPPATAYGPAPLAMPAQLALPPPQEVPRAKRMKLMPSTQGPYYESPYDGESDSESDSVQPLYPEPEQKKRKLNTDGNSSSGNEVEKKLFVVSSNKKDFGG